MTPRLRDSVASLERCNVRTTVRMTALGAGTLLALATLASPPRWRRRRPGGTVAFTNARIIDGTGRAPIETGHARHHQRPRHRRRSGRLGDDPRRRAAHRRDRARRSCRASSTPTRISTSNAAARRCPCATTGPPAEDLRDVRRHEHGQPRLDAGRRSRRLQADAGAGSRRPRPRAALHAPGSTRSARRRRRRARASIGSPTCTRT